MTMITTSDGFEADLCEKSSGPLQAVCEKLNQTHFGGALPEILVLAVTRFKHPTTDVVHAITLRTKEIPELNGLEAPWVILIHENHCILPDVAQYLLHEMTHVLLPDEDPFHSARFWATLREKWMLDMDLILGVGLNKDEAPSGLTKEILDLANLSRSYEF